MSVEKHANSSLPHRGNTLATCCPPREQQSQGASFQYSPLTDYFPFYHSTFTLNAAVRGDPFEQLEQHVIDLTVLS
jgi:hypothetical protein